MAQDRYDYIIVGAGSAGCAIAHRLSEDPMSRVLLLEAGGEDDHVFIKIPVGMIPTQTLAGTNWSYASAPEPHLDGRRIYVPRGKVMGGCSSINGLFHFRGHSADYDAWEALGCPGWSYEEVLPYFKRSETDARGETAYHGGSGPVEVNPVDIRYLMQEPLLASVRNAGFGFSADYNGAEEEGFATVDVTVNRRGRRSNTAQSYLTPIRNRANLTVLSRAMARRVVIRDGRAVGVEVEHAGQTRVIEAACEVVLSAGAYNSPQLLMLSGIGPRAELEALGIDVLVDALEVGANLAEHPRMPVQVETHDPVTFLSQLRFDRAVRNFLRWKFLGTGPFATQISNGHLICRSRPDLELPDLQLIFSPVRLDAKLWFPGLTPRQKHGMFLNICLLRPKSRGRMRLSSARIEDKPEIVFNILDHNDDLVAMREGVKIARRIFATEPFRSMLSAEIEPGPEYQGDEGIDAALHKLVDITHHPVGTCRMGSDARSVVDPELRVRGVAGLRVADASIMPLLPAANTNASAIMVGEKAADLIRGRSLPRAVLPGRVRHDLLAQMGLMAAE